MSCIYNNIFELTYSYGGHLKGNTDHLYYEDVIQVSRCCLLKPDWYVKSDDLLKTNDILEYLAALPQENLNKGFINHPMCAGNECILTPNDQVKEMIVGLSYACNLNCYHCWYAGHHNDTQFQKNLYFHVLNNIKGHGLQKITLTNKGEPFFYLNETMEYLKSLTINDTRCISAVTNGNCFSEDNVKLIHNISASTGINFVFLFSIDAITPQTYNKVRFGGNFEKVLKNLEHCVKNFGPENVAVSFTTKKPNLQEKSLAADFFQKNFGVNTQITTDYYDPEL